MRLVPDDILTYTYCPLLYRQGGHQKPPLSLLETCIRDSILLAEKLAIDSNSFVNPRKLIRTWDKLWWPRSIEAGIQPDKARKLATRAAFLLSDYCKYDITDEEHPSIAVEAESQVDINGAVITSHADLIKLSGRSGLVIVDFSHKNISLTDAAFSPAILTTAYSFSRDIVTNIQYICICINEHKRKLDLISSMFRSENLAIAERMLYHVVEGIKKEVFLPRPWLCEECQQCRISSK